VGTIALEKVVPRSASSACTCGIPANVSTRWQAVWFLASRYPLGAVLTDCYVPQASVDGLPVSIAPARSAASSRYRDSARVSRNEIA